MSLQVRLSREDIQALRAHAERLMDNRLIRRLATAEDHALLERYLTALDDALAAGAPTALRTAEHARSWGLLAEYKAEITRLRAALEDAA